MSNRLFWKKVAIVLAATFAGAILLASPFLYRQVTKPSKAEFRAELDKLAASSPSHGAFFREFRASFPEDLEKIQDQVTDISLSNTPTNEALSQVAAVMGRFIVEHRRDMSRAPARYLHELAKAQATFIKDLQIHDLQNCAQFAMAGSVTPSLNPSWNLNLVSDVNIAEIRAIRHGIGNPTERSGALTDAEQKDFHDGLTSRGLSSELIGKLYSGGLNNASVSEQCSIGVAVYGSIASLPPEIAADALNALVIAK